jgi:23S rRNA (uridine2552-2'-O)-methyltransferase
MKHSKQKKNSWADHYTHKAKKDGFPARSVYKLKEMQAKFRLIKRNDRVLDLGCAPGSWLRYTADQVGKDGYVVGVDLKPVSISLPAHVQILTGDIFEMSELLKRLGGSGYNLILSDMAPITTGHKSVDTARSFELSLRALTLAQKLLLPKGRFACKILQGENFQHYMELVKTAFGKFKNFRPKSTRKTSREIYILGFEKR